MDAASSGFLVGLAMLGGSSIRIEYTRANGLSLRIDIALSSGREALNFLVTQADAIAARLNKKT